MGCAAKFLVADFRVFQRKRHLLEMVNRKKNYSGILNSFDSAKPEITAKKLCFEYKLLFYPSDERAESSKHYSGYGLSGKFSSISGNSTPKKIQV